MFRQGLAKQTLEHTVVRGWWAGESSLWTRCSSVAFTTRWQCWESNPCIEGGSPVSHTVIGSSFHSGFMSDTNKTSKGQRWRVRQEFFNKPCKVDWWSLAGSPCCFNKIYLCTDTAVSTVRFILSQTHVLPQGSSGTGQFQDWTGSYAAGRSKQDVYKQSKLSSAWFSFLLRSSYQ